METPGPLDPYRPPIADPSEGDGSPRDSGGKREIAVFRAFELLKSGKDQWAVVNDLRARGLPFEVAKQESYPVFDEAKRRLFRNQLPLRAAAWVMIAAGILIPLGLFFRGGGDVLLSSVPVVFGMGILFKLPKPKRIHPDVMFGRGK